jgi:PHD/YefM family antitoxin component YafN of YafNO toxin-antitoxin module
MRGIQYITDDRGKKKAVVIDLDSYGELWEDFYDSLVARKRASEPRESLESVKKRLRKQEKLNG